MLEKVIKFFFNSVDQCKSYHNIYKTRKSVNSTTTLYFCKNKRIFSKFVVNIILVLSPRLCLLGICFKTNIIIFVYTCKTRLICAEITDKQ